MFWNILVPPCCGPHGCNGSMFVSHHRLPRKFLGKVIPTPSAPRISHRISKMISSPASIISDPFSEVPTITVSDSGLANGLAPPVGTRWFHSEESSILDNVRVHADDLEYYHDITWRVRWYLYAVNADPSDPEFTTKGGAIYVILVHFGHVDSGPTCFPSATYFEGVFDFQVKAPEDSGVVPLLQLPETGSGISKDLTTEYVIDYSATYEMLSDKEENSSTFFASYNEHFVRDGTTQRGDILFPDVVELQIRLDAKTQPKPNSRHEIRGLSVFKGTTLSSWPVTLEFSHSILWEFLPVCAHDFVCFNRN
ncbi:hypothetical protein HGRIS_011063 [Hohenbuehelia grisea]|uniref:Uncharacterized protein n=1 Tax=Hohenbuehelia grisea TaxID=104357 RepID=A0ABR3IZ49_9AGAR